jgi:type IV pilus assembly protein PilF
VALDEVKQAINIDPTRRRLSRSRADLHGHERDRLAEDSFRTALNMRDSDPDVLNNYGWFLCQNNRYAEAKAMLQRAVAPSMGPVKPLTNLGACEMRNGDLISAEESPDGLRLRPQ